MQLKSSKKANTLAELLIVLTIMGVVLALTIPGLQKTSQRTEMAQLLKKGYYSVNQSIDKALVEREENSISEWNLGDDATVMNNYFKPYLNVLYSCGSGDTRCFASAYNFMDGSASYNFSTLSSASILMPDGVAIQVAECNGSMCHIHIDVNGPNPPNIVGVDHFEFVLDKTQNKLYPYYLDVNYNHAKRIMDDGWEIKYW